MTTSETFFMPSSYDQSEVLELLTKPGYLAKAVYILCEEICSNPQHSSHTEFLMGMALCNARLDAYHFQLEREPLKNMPYADPQILFCGFQHFRKAYMMGCNPEEWKESYGVQQQTAGLLLDFIATEQRDPHMSSMKVAGTPFRVLQLGYLCLVQLAPRFIPSNFGRARDYQTFIEWGKNYSAK